MHAGLEIPPPPRPPWSPVPPLPQPHSHIEPPLIPVDPLWEYREVVRDPVSVASGLRAHLAARPAGLVALAAHARSGLERLRLGATAADLVRTSTAPALVVPFATS